MLILLAVHNPFSFFLFFFFFFCISHVCLVMRENREGASHVYLVQGGVHSNYIYSPEGESGVLYNRATFDLVVG